MREVKTEGLTAIGNGVSGEVFRWGEDRVLKLYRENYSLPQVENAFRIAEYVTHSPIPCPAVYEMVSCGNRYGVISEYMDIPMLLSRIADGTFTRAEAGRKMGRLMKTIHGMPPADFLPGMKQMLSEVYDRCGTRIPPEAKKRFLDFLDRFPGQGYLLHGDFHEGNVMVRDGELVLLDLDSLCVGSPVFEFQQTFTVYRTEIPAPPDVIAAIHLTPEETDEFLYAMLAEYFGTEDRQTLAEYEEVFTRISGLNRFLAKVLQAPKEQEDEIRAFVAQELPAMERLVEESADSLVRLPF